MNYTKEGWHHKEHYYTQLFHSFFVLLIFLNLIFTIFFPKSLKSDHFQALKKTMKPYLFCNSQTGEIQNNKVVDSVESHNV